ncbi:glycerophosphodiester phosphodiesterase [Staphylococcus lutrae]|uniref:Glycerophosphodiester phosphodiesterase n=1 Tax=Staphylococcus lutrae TaxID=155085 RepID=A0AAC9RTL1_9STAP|nr:glycerophosphodiester phosphodiesterase [Staphylococcus lutrae]ARJ51559.1 glycerophosphodiester phosphodiesterase [Staphylococcus lutrae]PNZ39203.1 glycerophosphodiester phosphodiesterase [Staphylococcus lutrae]
MTPKSTWFKRAVIGASALFAGTILFKQRQRPNQSRVVPPFFDAPAPYILSHRGGMQERPESTVLAFNHSVEMGLTGFETDIRISKDGHVIVFHDADVNRTTNGSGRVSQYTLSALKSLDAGYHFKDINGTYPYRNHPDAKVITMNELLSRYPNQYVNIDIKDHPDSHEGKIAAQKLYDVIVQNQAQSRVLVTSFYRKQIKRFKSISRGTVAIGASQYDVTEGILLCYSGLQRTYRGQAQTFQMPTHFHGLPLVQSKLIRWLNASKVIPGYYGINNVDLMHHLVRLGVHTIVTDRPTIGRQFLSAYHIENDRL